jgi:hypothetical protein
MPSSATGVDGPDDGSSFKDEIGHLNESKVSSKKRSSDDPDIEVGVKGLCGHAAGAIS